ncbi:hypothetical protein [Streptococcus pneumoniae]|uniref:hypothetical protein n=1 Tax=Streptococcus pneumoniae TaxID=1313 RepID=UPI00099E8956|nr:hypothetical protein [Streptococcus pneumoniae]
MSLFIIGHMGLFFYTKIGSIISIRDLPTTNIIEPKKLNSMRFLVEIFPSIFATILNKNQKAN